MKYEQKRVTIKELIENYINDEENGVFGYNRKLSIRPPFQREFVYDDKKKSAVIETIKKDMPIGVMWWSENEDGTYELLDGQQRTISICEFVTDKYSIYTEFIDGHKGNYKFSTLSKELQDRILNYELMVYVFSGTTEEKLSWFKTINIAGEVLTQQELRNAVYVGSWLEDGKKHFSKNNCVAYLLGKDYMNGSPIRQDYLEKVIEWKANYDNILSKDSITEYMSNHKDNHNANELWQYFQDVISWTKKIFPNYRKTMKGIEWGILYNKYHNNYYDSELLEEKIKELENDVDVTKPKGIYEYLLSGEEKHLNIRAFDVRDKHRKYIEQNGVCPKCGKTFIEEQMDGDHIIPWNKGGKTNYDNLQMLCIYCNRSNK